MTYGLSTGGMCNPETASKGTLSMSRLTTCSEMFAFTQKQVENTAPEFILNVTGAVIATLRELLHCHLLPSG